MVKPNTYITIQAFMVNDLHLKGNELLVYAIIYGFTQDGQNEFTGSLQYLADWTQSTKQGVMKALQSLCEKQLILKNVEYKNNIRFCTYKSTVLNKVEQGIKQSLTGYETEFNGGIKQSLPNNINNILDNKLEHTQEECVPSYVQQEFIPKKEDVYIVGEMFNLLQAHNSSQPKHKIPISKGLFNFQCKEGRDILQLLKQDSPENILQALENYLIVSNMESWKTSFSFGAFCKSFTEYTPEFFDISKYDKETDKEQICDNFIKQMEKEKDFDTGTFWQNRADWLEKGRPQGAEYYKWQKEKWHEMGLE